MLSNAYFLAKFRFDTAENEPAKNLQKFANFPNFANEASRLVRADLGTDLVAAAVHPAEALELPARALLQQEHDLALRCKQGLALNLDFELIQIVELTPHLELSNFQH